VNKDKGAREGAAAGCKAAAQVEHGSEMGLAWRRRTGGLRAAAVQGGGGKGRGCCCCCHDLLAYVMAMGLSAGGAGGGPQKVRPG
jgi:hypothetical protein